MARAVSSNDRLTSMARRLQAAETVAEVGTCEVRGQSFVECSAEFLHIHGFDPAAPPAELGELLDRMHPDDRAPFSDAISAALTSREPYRTRYRVIRPEGSVRVVRGSGIVVPDGPDSRVVYGAAEDVTEHDRAVTRLAAAEWRYAAIVEHANDGIWILNRQGATTFVNRRMSELLGYPPSEILGRAPSDFADDEDTGAADERRTHFERRYRRGDGTPLWTVTSRSDLPATHGGGTVLVVTDITRRKQMEERLRHAAENDSLTGLINRSRFEQLLDELLERDEGPEDRLALVFLDLDHVRYVNDAFGHAVGDAVIREVSERLRELMRQDDILARFAGDEFAIALPGASQEVAMCVAKRCLVAIREGQWQTLSRLTASIGVVVADAAGPCSRSELLIAAGSALHDAKSSGRDQIAVYRGQGGKGGFHWIGEIRAALEEDRLVLYGQPIVPTAGSGSMRHELLLRMLGRGGELIPPGSFIPAAEQFGLMPELDRWVVRQALELAREGAAVEVNLSGASLGDQEIRCLVENAVAGGVRPDLLTFEVTETAAARNITEARGFADQLELLGCTFALDDFGTGFGSLVYLKNLPVSQLKIDIEFVRDLVNNEADQRLVRAIVQMAEPLGLETVAEGVEDEATFELLRELGVDFAQGYWIGRPAPLSIDTLLPKARR